MSKVILVTGGARSGKSTYAENLLNGKENVLYIATAVAYDEEMKERIKLHQAQRTKDWETLEAFDGLDRHLKERGLRYDGILLDCITVMITNLLFSREDFDENEFTKDFWSSFENEVILKLKKLMEEAKSTTETFIMVTNEIGMGLVPETYFSREFRDCAGRINQFLAREADEVYFLVSGIPMKIKEKNCS